MKEQIDFIVKEMTAPTVTPEGFIDTAKEIASTALDHFNGELLKKGLAIAYAVAAFAHELERPA